MNLQGAIVEGKRLIQVGNLSGKDTRRIEEKVKELEKKHLEIVESETNEITLETISVITMGEFKKRNLAVEVYSEFLDEIIWFCSNTDMAKQIKEDAPDDVCYTVAELYELQELSLLEPSNEMLKGINNVKSVFEDSKIIETKKLRGKD